MDRIQFGTFLANLRKEKSLSQQELADLLYISPQAVSKWERAESLPDIESLQKLSILYNITIDNLLQCKNIEVQITPSPVAKSECQYFKGINNPKLFTALFGMVAALFYLILFAIPIEEGVNLYSAVGSNSYIYGNYFILFSLLFKLAIFSLSAVLIFSFTKHATKNILLARHIVVGVGALCDLVFVILLIMRPTIIVYGIFTIAFVALYFALPNNRFKRTLSEFNN